MVKVTASGRIIKVRKRSKNIGKGLPEMAYTQSNIPISFLLSEGQGLFQSGGIHSMH